MEQASHKQAQFSWPSSASLWLVRSHVNPSAFSQSQTYGQDSNFPATRKGCQSVVRPPKRTLIDWHPFWWPGSNVHRRGPTYDQRPPVMDGYCYQHPLTEGKPRTIESTSFSPSRFDTFASSGDRGFLEEGGRRRAIVRFCNASGWGGERKRKGLLATTDGPSRSALLGWLSVVI
jgi:hypothetical protein